jgi:hypothetical protein
MQDHILERLLDDAEATGAQSDAKAPSRLKSRIYSALMRQHAASGPLLALSATRAAGRALCVFESLTSACSPDERVEQLNLCRVCHARVLGEHVESAPIFWHSCPYVDFQKR